MKKIKAKFVRAQEPAGENEYFVVELGANGPILRAASDKPNLTYLKPGRVMFRGSVEQYQEFEAALKKYRFTKKLIAE